MKNNLDEFIKNKKSMSHNIIKLEYYDEDTLCTVIAADFSDKSLICENYVDINIKTSFGNNKNPSWEDFEYFLSERCIPKARAGLRYYLDVLGIDEYNPFEIIKKTMGRMAEDKQWIKICEE